MARNPKTLQGQYNDISRRYFGGTLPECALRYVEPSGEGSFVDTRGECAAVAQDELTGAFTMEVDGGLERYPDLRYLVLAHECLHLSLAKAGVENWTSHKSKEWNTGVRRLTGAGLLRRVF